MSECKTINYEQQLLVKDATIKALQSALADIVDDLELRSGMKWEAKDRGVVECGCGVYERACAVLDKAEVKRARPDILPDEVVAVPRSEIEELRKDAARLNWISGEYIKIDPVTIAEDDAGWQLSQYRIGRPSEVLIHKHYADNLRGAIDAAMQEAKP